MRSARNATVAVVLVTLAGCSPVAPAAPVGSAPGSAAVSAPASPKIVTIATLVRIPGFGPWDVGTTQGGWAALAELASTGLVADAPKGGPEPRLAVKLPSFDDGSIVLLPDGRMQTVWHLRSGVRWHDGAPFTAEDLALSVQMYQHPDLPKGNTATVVARVERIEAPDPLTAVVTWKAVFAGAVSIDLRTLWPYPAHLLTDAFQGDKQVFPAHPYFTTDYVGLGPFRLANFGQGESQVFERFDDYYLGRPKIDRVIIRPIGDANILYANLQAGTVDVASEQTMPHSLFLQIRDEWKSNGEGIVLQRQGIWRYLMVQHRAEIARLPEVARDVRLRRGLLLAIDRDALRESVLPGVPNTGAESFMAPSDPRAAIVGQPFAGFKYDPGRALADLADSGWRSGADGRIVNAAMERVEIPLRTSVQYPHEASIVADYWRRIGLDVSEEITSAALTQNNEHKAKFPMIDVSGRGFNEAVLQYFDSRLVAGPENRWGAANVPGYANSDFDRVVDRLARSFDGQEQGQLLRQAAEILAMDLPVLPTYFAVWMTAVRNPVQALHEDYAATVQSSGVARNAHLWDRV
ncbi:MAG: hypothetical protein HW416_2063 [Chloroflexi bacterium]|nr:hypothetical protein [Chloroflexota bacterium]